MPLIDKSTEFSPVCKPRGRPPKNGSVTVKKMASPVTMVPVKPITIETDKDLNKLPKVYKCSCCGKMTMSPMNKFYKNSKLTAFAANEGYGFVCSECVRKLYDEYKETYNDEKLALFLVCIHTGHYFNELLYETMRQTGESVQIGIYFRTLNNTQWDGGTILNNILELYDHQKLFRSDQEIHEKLEGSWKPEERRNMNACIRQLGYDPFDDDVYSNNDRKFLFNALSDYLKDDSVLDDPHKVQCIIHIVKSLHQISILDTKTTMLLRATSSDNTTYKYLTESITRLQASVNQTAKDNGLSLASGGKNSRSQKTFTGIVRDMVDSGVLEAKPNSYDSLTDTAYQHIAEISHKALINELNFTSDEYAKMVAEQSETIRSQDEQILKLTEELRLERVALDKFKNPKKYIATPFKNGKVFTEAEGSEPDLVEADGTVI